MRHMMEEKKPAVVLHLLILLLAISYLLSLEGVAASRSLASRNPVLPELDKADQVTIGELITEEEFLHGRMDIESNDYPGSGANNRHDPKPPGRF